MLIKSLHLKNILSFKDARLDLQPLNVLIGANGSGKSNLIDVIGLLQAVPGDLPGFLRRNGPTGDWVWKGPGREETPFHLADIVARFDNPGQAFNYELGSSSTATTGFILSLSDLTSWLVNANRRMPSLFSNRQMSERKTLADPAGWYSCRLW